MLSVTHLCPRKPRRMRPSLPMPRAPGLPSPSPCPPHALLVPSCPLLAPSLLPGDKCCLYCYPPRPFHFLSRPRSVSPCQGLRLCPRADPPSSGIWFSDASFPLVHSIRMSFSLGTHVVTQGAISAPAPGVQALLSLRSARCGRSPRPLTDQVSPAWPHTPGRAAEIRPNEAKSPDPSALPGATVLVGRLLPRPATWPEVAKAPSQPLRSTWADPRAP